MRINRKSIAVAVLLIVGSTSFGARMFITLPTGSIRGAFVEYNDPNTIDITAGYGECNGSYWEVLTTTQHDMTGLTAGEDFHYIYVDDANSVYPDPVFIDRVTEPIWTDSKLGWYNGNDRCIGVVWSPDSTIAEFTDTPDLEYVVNVGTGIKEVLYWQNPTGSWQTIDTSAYIPVNAIAVYAYAWNQDFDGRVAVDVCPYENESVTIHNDSWGYANCVGWLGLKRNASRYLKWYGYNDDENHFSMDIRGFKIER
jgi:hypothetical protein